MKNILIKLKSILLLVSTIVLVQSCELKSEIYDAINPLIFPTTAADVDALVTANAYGVFRNDGYSGIFNVAHGINTINDICSDYGACSWAWSWDNLAYVQYEVSKQDLILQQYEYMPFISKMTLTLDRIKNVQMDETVKAMYVAELRLGRGWLAMLLFDYYGGIVIADTETLKKPIAEINLPRMTNEQMVTYIETELSEAAKVLPYNYKKGDAKYGRFTKGLANTVLLKLYMHTKQWEKAEEMGRELMKSEYAYSLVPEYADIFKLANEKNAEIIWAVQCKTGFQQHKWQPHILPNDYDYTPFLSSLTKWNGFKMTWDYFNTFDLNDKRRETLIYDYTSKAGVHHNQENDANNPSAQLYLGCIPLKYEIDPATTGENSQVDWIVYRYADVLTLTAEAIVRNKGITSEAVDLLNQVRERALPSKGYKLSDFTNADQLLQAILDERGWELYFEGARRTDLIRHGKYIDQIKAKAERKGMKTLVDETRYIYPFPQSWIDEGKGVIVQNPGY